MFSKRKERPRWSFERRRPRTGSKASKEVTNLNSNAKVSKEVTNSNCNASKGEEHRSRKSYAGGGRHPGRRSSSSNSETNDKSRIRTRRRKRRRMRARENQEANDGFKSQKKQGHRKSKPKRKGTTRVIAGCSESSWSGSYPQPSSNTCALQNLSQVIDHNSNASSTEYFNLPWGNLDLPMDLSHIEFEVNDKHAVDFELLAQKNHERWLANLEKVRGCCEWYVHKFVGDLLVSWLSTGAFTIYFYLYY